MLRTICSLIGLTCMVTVIRGIGFSQSTIDAAGVSVYNSQQQTSSHGEKSNELAVVSAKAWTSFGSFDRGFAWLAGSGQDSLRNGSSDYAGSGRTGKETIVIELKAPVSVFDIVGLTVDQKSNGHLIRIHCTKQLPEFESWLKPIGEDTWLYITLVDAKADVAVLQDFKLTAFIKKILVFELANSVQLTFMLKGPVKSAELIPEEGSEDILVAVFTPEEEQLAVRKGR